MADTPKSSLSVPRTTAEFFRTPSMEDDEAPLIGRSHEEVDDDDKPAFKFTFSFVRTLRLIIFPVDIVACAFAGNPERKPGLAVMTIFFLVLVLMWNTFQILNSLGRPNGKNGGFQIKIGTFECVFRRTGADPFHLRRRFSYMVNVTDLALCGLMIIPSVVLFYENPYGAWYSDDRTVPGLCIAVASLQLILAVVGLFSFFRKVKVCVYSAEFDEKAGIRIPENYHDGDLLSRGGPSTSSVAVV